MGMTNVGNRPTFNGKGVTIETNILDFSADIYGQNMRIAFVDRIRAEVKFDTIDQLKAKMKEDEEVARRLVQQHLEGFTPALRQRETKQG